MSLFCSIAGAKRLRKALPNLAEAKTAPDEGLKWAITNAQAGDRYLFVRR
jgi:hypothetical protein